MISIVLSCVLLAAAESLPTEKPAGELEAVALFRGPMPTGVTVSQDGRVFVNFPRWGDDVDYTVAEVKDGQTAAYPDADMNKPDTTDPGNHLISVQSVVVGPDNRLWILDTANIEFKGATPGGPKLIGVNLATNEAVKKFVFPADVALPTTYLNDVRFDLRRGREGYAFITDSSTDGPNAIIVVDLASGEAWRRLNDHTSVRPDPAFLPLVEGRVVLQDKPGEEPMKWQVGSDGIAISSDGERLYYCPLSSRHLYSVSVEALIDRAQSDEQVAATVQDHGEKGASDGLESDAQGRVYLTEYEHNAILRGQPGGPYETIAHDPRLMWPDTLSVGPEGWLYVTANQLHRQPQFHDGQDLREKPYVLFRLRTDARPVALK